MEPVHDIEIYAREAFREMDEGIAHLSIEDIAAWLQGQRPGALGTEVERHLAQCAACRDTAEELQEFASDEATPPVAPDEIDAAFRAVQRRLEKPRVMQFPWRLEKPRAVQFRWRQLAMAASAILVVGLGPAGYRWLNPSSGTLLAQAWHEQRTSDIRLAGAEWAPVTQQRAGGSAFQFPASLLKAQAAIQERLRSGRTTAELLRLRGEAEMMTRAAGAAVRTLEQAADLEPENPAVLADLGAAYIMRGDAEQKYGDYLPALDRLAEAIKRNPSDTAAKFNRALVLERMMLYDQAVEEWKNFLNAAPSGDWAREARQRLNAAEERLKKKAGAMGEIGGGPARYLALDARRRSALAEPWLLRVAEPYWLTGGALDNEGRAALNLMASNLATEHHDPWLQDLTECRGEESDRGLTLIRRSESLWAAHDAEGAVAAAREAAAAFTRENCSAGVLRSQYAAVIVLHDSIQSERCRAEAQRLRLDLQGRPYLLLRALTDYEYGVCALRTGRVGEARLSFLRAEELARANGFGEVALRARNAYIQTAPPILPSEVLAATAQLIATFWDGAYAPALYQVLVFRLREQAQNEGRIFAVLHLARSEAWAAAADGRPQIEGPARAQLAAPANAVSSPEESEANMAIGLRLTNGLPPSYRMHPTALLAQIDLGRGNPGSALAALLGLGVDPTRVTPTPLELSEYYATLGETWRRSGKANEAEVNFRKAISTMAPTLTSAASERERRSALKAIETGYRGLVETRFRTPGGEAAALDVWREFRREFSGSDEPANSGVTLRIIALADGYVGWLTNGAQVMARRVETPVRDLANVARRFLRESATR
jgi:tetratricopeptide (TPR) repeat protein